MRKLLVTLFLLTILSAVAQFTPSLGLVAFYPFDGDANDYSGNNNNGMVNGATLTTDRFNIPNRAYSFDGFNDYILVPGSASFDVLEQNNEVTITAWINIRAWYQNWSHFMMIERHRASDDNGWGFAILKQPAEVSIFYPQDMAMADTIGFQPTFNTWYHVAVSWNKNIDDSARMYINGVKRKTFKTNYPAITGTNNGSVYIGRSIVGIDEYSDGKIDELGVYRRVLSDLEIFDIFQGCQTPVLSASGSQTVTLGNTVQFSVVSTNTAVTYQWQANTGLGYNNLANTPPYSGVNTSILTISNVAQANNNTFYRCIVSGCGTVSTTPALLTVTAPIGIRELGNEEIISIYPNPAKELVVIDGLHADDLIQIYDATGRCVLKDIAVQLKKTILLETFSSGLYMLAVNGQPVTRLVVGR